MLRFPRPHNSEVGRARKIIGVSRIHWRIAEEIKKYEACSGVIPADVYWHVEDERGCIWNVNIWKGTAACTACVEDAVNRGCEEYNIVEPL